ncbi:MAG: glycosyltransferase family 4 protein [bacterium]|nr:glycosyltransferase family 4 protein [bacterium]
MTSSEPQRVGPTGGVTQEMTEPGAAHTAACTIVSANYLARARVLMETVARQHPDWDRHVLLVDEIAGRFDPAEEDFELMEADALGLEGSRALFFRYTILELNTALKAPFLSCLFRTRGYDRVVYIDPDVELLRPMEEVETVLDEGALMCLTPHLLARNGDDCNPTELDIVRAGSYNLGFIALARHPQLESFLDWWWEKLEYHCLVDFEAGLFVDQKWMDLVPGLFGDVHIIRDPGYNVAYWNMGYRRLVRSDSGYSVDGRALVFFHYSGLDPLAPETFSSHQDRFTLSQLGDARPLVLAYCESVKAAGEETLRKLAYAFGTFRDGTPIVDEVRALYRESAQVQADAGQDPFALGIDYFNAPVDGRLDGPVVSRLAYHLWSSRPDLQASFPQPLGVHRFEFVRWFSDCAIDAGLPAAFVLGIRQTLSDSRDAPARSVLKSRARRVAMWLKPKVAPFLSRPIKDFLKRWLMEPVTPPRRQAFLPADRTTLRPTVGLYEQDEHDLATGQTWMGEVVEILLPETEARRLSIEGEHRARFHERAHGRGRLSMDVELDGFRVGRFVLEEDGAFIESIELDHSLREPHLLTLRPDQTFIPADLGEGADSRTLSVRLSQVLIDDHPLLDFGRSQAAQATAMWQPRGYAADAPRASALEAVNLIGYFRQDLGIGESVRLGTAAARASGVHTRLVDFSAGCTSRAGDMRFEDELSTTNPYPINLIHVNADQLPLALETLGPDFFEGRHTVGIWHWELPDFPDEWCGSFDLVDELWAPSRFIQDCLSAKSPVPVVHMPHAITLRSEGPVDRAEFGLPSEDFLFLTMYDMHSFQARKNPEAVLAAFRRAFPDAGQDGVGLVIKVMNAESAPEDSARLREWAVAIPGVRLLERTLDRAEVDRLENACDAFVSLHRSEGFGLGLAESMALGKPVIGTGWSGNLDFMTAENSALVDYTLVEVDQDYGPYRRGQVWAEPDVDDAARWMRLLVEDGEVRERIARAGRRTIREEFSPDEIGRRQRRRIELIVQRSGFARD